MADSLVKATLLRDHVVNGGTYHKGDEVEVTPTEERWGRYLGVYEGGFEEGEALGGPDPNEVDYDDNEGEENATPEQKPVESSRAAKARKEG